MFLWGHWWHIFSSWYLDLALCVFQGSRNFPHCFVPVIFPWCPRFCLFKSSKKTSVEYTHIQKWEVTTKYKCCVTLFRSSLPHQIKRQSRLVAFYSNLSFHSQEWSSSNFSCTSHSMENLAFPSLLRLKDDSCTSSHYLTYTFLFKRLRRCTFWAWDWKG